MKPVDQQAGKRKAGGNTSSNRKKKYRSADGTPVWSKRAIEGPGVWVSCIRGKEKQTIGELSDLFESLVNELWPGQDENGGTSVESPTDANEDSIEAQIAKEMSAMKGEKKERLFANCDTNTDCVVFFSCKPPIDPVQLVVRHVKNVEETGVTRTRFIHRLVPVSGSCVTNLPEIEALCHNVYDKFFESHPGRTFRYKIELRVRNHTTLTRQTIIQSAAGCVPSVHVVDLTNPEIFILVEVFKSVCGISVVEDYYRYQKFNVMELANHQKLAHEEKGRMADTSASGRGKEQDQDKAESVTVEVNEDTENIK